ncbi:MAG: phospho-N-acetylmuramoyl-pentapeptide-transferase [Chloroflexi bacterium]|nr:phospho-N-acetylmuramoyl-pentapeptide-transferase [Chloroflexota bacterium]
MSLSVALLAGIAAFVVLVPLGKPLIAALLHHNVGKHIRSDGPAQHQVKSGTPTMGGILFVGGTLVFCLLAAALGTPAVLLPCIALAMYAAVGTIDDIMGLHDVSGVGWLARNKFPVQWGAALITALALGLLTERRGLAIPWLGTELAWGWWGVALAVPALVFISNAVNLTDGQDGLAGGISALVYAALGLVTALAPQPQLYLSFFCLVMAGSLSAFLWFNTRPASVFMGDIGSEALGAGMVAVAMLSGQWIAFAVMLLPIVIEGPLTVMLQVAWFKYTKRRYGEGRRIFRMSPLHHHFELLGIPEERITVRFWLVSAACCALAAVLVLIGRGA